MSREKRWNTIIRNPGKFEGEPVAVRFYWKLSLDGADQELYDGDDYYAVFNNVPETGLNLVLWETDQGFVYHNIVTDDELEEFRLSTL